MRSIVEEAIKRTNEESGYIVDASNERDLELEEIIKGLQTRIAVIGCGGGGSNTMSRMTEEGIYGANLVALNTDAQHLIRTKSDTRILIGRKRTRGLGAGSVPQVGEEAALENVEEINQSMTDCDMVFITAGLGGGTGTGSAPSLRKLHGRPVRLRLQS